MRSALTGWWSETFTQQEQDVIAEQFTKYPPMGTTYNLRRLPSDARFLLDASTWFTRADMGRIRILILNEAVRQFQGQVPPRLVDLHYAYAGLLEAWYKLRVACPEAIERATEYCLQMIEIAPKVQVGLKKEGVWRRNEPVGNPGFYQLTVIYDKQGRWGEAIALCDQAKEQGWSGDWDARRARYEKKLARGTR